MVDTVNAFDIPSVWTDLSTLTGITIGTALALQPVGKAGDIVEIFVQDAEPSTSDLGVKVWFAGPLYYIDSGENRVWARYKRIDTVPTGLTTPLQVQVI